MLPGECLHEIVAARAAAHPDRVAVTAGDRSLTYRELDERARRLADRLQADGLRPDTPIGLLAERGPELVVGMLGILAAGGGYVPVDPDYPAARVDFLLRDSGVRHVVTTARCRPVLDGGGHDVVVIGAEGPVREGGAPAASRPDHLAYVIYTSGSTGTPKGVLVEHRQVVRLFGSVQPWFGFGPDDVWTMFHSASFDFSVWEVWGALLHGGRVVVVPRAVTRAPAAFRELLAAEGVTVLSQTPSAFAQLVAGPDGPAAPPALRWVVFGGERLDVGLLRPWLARHGDERPGLVNMYGITETTVHVTYHRVRVSDLDTPGESPIGVPIPDLRVRLLDEAARPVRDGTPGEIHVGGPGVTRGYHCRPRLTAERFLRRPGGRREYRSGDLAVRRPDGVLVYRGRLDDQVKVRGHRIEPGEVEACLARHSGVAAVVVTTAEAGGEVKLVAHVQRVPGTGPDLPEVLAGLARAELPAHLRPADYRVVRRLPLTPQGKADRAALARAGRDSGRTGVEDEDQEGPMTEETVAAIVAEAMGREGIDSAADLFDLGLTSLAFIRIVATVNEKFGLALNGSELGDTASIARLAVCVDERTPSVTTA